MNGELKILERLKKRGKIADTKFRGSDDSAEKPKEFYISDAFFNQKEME